MDSFVVSARKYRPQKFEDVVGQQSIANTLKLAIKNNKLASAYLFCGPRGVGKTTCARIFAKAINCLNPQGNGEACEECESCQSFNEQRSINIQELNAAANNSVDDIRAIIDQVRIPPQLGKYKVIILDEVHMLSQAAGNALLKTLEEPPSYVIFILATTEKHKIMQTILSRCQIFDFNRMEISDIVGNLKMVAQNEGITCEEAALNVIAQKADGGMRDALSIFDQVSNYSQGNVTYDSVLQCINALDYDYYFKMTNLLVQHNVTEAMLLFNEIVNKGFNGGVFIGGMASHFRDLLMSRDQSTLPLLNVADSLKQRYTEQARTCSVKFLYFAIRTCDRCSNEYKSSLNKRLSVEITLIETAQFSEEDSVGAGRRPAKILKPLFTQTALVQQAVQAAQTAQPSAPAARATVAKPASNEETAPTAATGTQSTGRKIISKRPSLKAVLAIAGQISNKEQDNASATDTTAAAPDSKAAMPSAKPKEETVPNNPDDDNDNYSDNDDNYDEYSDSQVDSNDIIIYSKSQIEIQWQKCCEIIRKESVPMASRMQAMPLECTPEHIIIVSLHNELTRKQFVNHVPMIEDFLRKVFNLPDIRIETKILPPEIVRVITNPTELLEKMRKDNPHFAEFADKLKLQIG